MDKGALFDKGPQEDATPAEPLPPRVGPKRLRHAVRNQVEFQECSLDELLPGEHEARIVWDYVCGLDLSELRQRIQAVEGGPGQAPADPRILLALWLYATLRGVDATNSGGDQGQLAPMVEQHQERYAEKPREALVDGGFVKKADIDQVSPPQGGTTVYAPVMESKDPNRDPHTPRDDDSPAVAEWRQRMATAEAKAIYRERAATAECVNALARNRGLRQFLVRGLRKVKAVVLWYALAHNLMRAVALRAAAAQAVVCNG